MRFTLLSQKSSNVVIHIIATEQHFPVELCGTLGRKTCSWLQIFKASAWDFRNKLFGSGSRVKLFVRVCKLSLVFVSAEEILKRDHSNNETGLYNMALHLLIISDGFITFNAKADWIFKAHDRIRWFIATTFITNCSATLPTVMLKNQSNHAFSQCIDFHKC